MSRRSGTQSNTLLNYFQSPKGKTPQKNEEKKENISELKENGKDTAMQVDQEAEEDIIANTPKRKRIRIVDTDSDSDHENTPSNDLKAKKTKKSKTSSTPNGEDVKKNLQLFGYKKSDTANQDKNPETPKKTSMVETAAQGDWKHNRLPFLQPDKIRDAEKRSPRDPDYDSRTLYVPDDFLNSQTPAMRQWWVLKSKHMDTVLFFKVGKFYELYHMDAVVGVNELGFSYMKGEFAHSGFPEIAYGKMASALIDKGYKVARVEQTETPDMMAERCKATKKPTKYDKVVRREICQISNKASCIYNAQMPDAPSAMPCYLYALTEKSLDSGKIRIGVCFVDTSIGTFHLSDFEDDQHFSRLLALFAENTPGMILLERGHVRAGVLEVLNVSFRDVAKEYLSSGNQFSSGSDILNLLRSGPYFVDTEGNFQWPPVLEQISEDSSPKPQYELALKALSACVWFLKDSQIDVQVLSLGKFKLYSPIDLNVIPDVVKRDYMVLDSSTLCNLQLLGETGTLQKTLNFCSTSFGKRLLAQWICRPLCDPVRIKERQEAIKELVNNRRMLNEAQSILKKLPDLERLIAKIHIYGNKFCSVNHPDSRAIFYEAKSYSKRRIQDLLDALQGFEQALGIVEIFKGCSSKILTKITQHQPEGSLRDITPTLQFFKEAFDQKQAKEEGTMTPRKGLDQDYDGAEDQIKSIKEEADKYLKEQSKYFGCTVVYFGTDKKRYQLEVPESGAKKANHNYQLEGAKKGAKPCKRFSTAETKSILARMLKAESIRADIIQDLNRRIFERFSQEYTIWENVIHCLTYLDVLCSLATYTATFKYDICLPTFLPHSEKSSISIIGGRHPCILSMDTFVPNDVTMGTADKAGIVLITGPNMGGKSTLMRQVALIVIMAQIGSYVPATSCELQIADRIFTRLGAQDHIIGGQSTFLVELLEASSILQHATSHSLVLLDELGRGTSTHDGNAIATAYVKKLVEMKCRTLFSTHYHSLIDYFDGENDIQLGHMACMVENDKDATEEAVTFLYKFLDGRCPKSYGFNAARLAGLRNSVIARAREISQNLESETKNLNTFVSIYSNSFNLRELIRCID